MTTLIQGGTVYDGTGGVPRETDVLIHGASIARMGSRLGVKARHVVDARGSLVIPGLVDIASYADHYGALFSDPAGTESLTRGITSFVVGHGGASQAPLLSHGTMPERWWGNAASGAAHPTAIKEFFSLMKGRMGMNVGTLVGYATVREGITHGMPRDLTDREFELMERMFRQALREGALGISVNVEYTRTAHTPRHELLAAARAVKDADGLLAFRLRNREGALKEGLAEALAVSDATDVNLLVTDLEPHVREEANYRALLTQITRASADHNVHFTTSGTGVAAFPLPLLLPPHLREQEWSEMRMRLKDPSFREELRAHLARYRDLTIHVAAVADASLKLFEGTPFSKWSLHEHLPFEEALMRFMEVTGFRAVLAMRVGESELGRAFVAHDRALIASGEAAAPSLEASAHLDLLSKKEYDVFPLEQRIARMTGAPAKKVGLPRRGTLKEGNYADILVLEKGAVREVFVNGTRAVSEGVPTNARSGAVLSRT